MPLSHARPAARRVTAAVVMVFLLVVARRVPAQTPPPGAGYFWSYSVKFVCGFHGEGAPVKPANYLTEIGLHNYNYKNIPVWKKLVITVGQDANGAPILRREPEQAVPTGFTKISLGPDGGTMDDCVAITSMAGVAQGTPMIGYLVITSPLDLDIDAAYTAEVPGTGTAAPTGISVDVERVAGKRVFIPAGTLP